jgi:hypothetical protein
MASSTRPSQGKNKKLKVKIISGSLAHPYFYLRRAINQTL